MDYSKNFTFKEKSDLSKQKEVDNNSSKIIDPLPDNVLFVNFRMLT